MLRVPKGSRYDVPEIARFLKFATSKFGELVPANQHVMLATNSKKRIRVALGRSYKQSENFRFHVGDGDFDWLLIGLDGRDEVWLVKASSFSVPVRGPVWLYPGKSVSQAREATLKGNFGSIDLSSSLVFPSKSTVLQAQRQEREQAKRDRRRAEVLDSQRAKAVARPDEDADFSRLFANVSMKLGRMSPITRTNWKLENGETVYFAVSKPHRRTIDRALLGLKPTAYERDWLAICVRGSEASWLIPMEVVRSFIKSRMKPDGTSYHMFCVGFKDGWDRLWMANESSLDIGVTVDNYKLYSSAPNKALLARAERERVRHENEVQAAIIRGAKATSRFETDENTMAVSNALEAVLGPLKVTSFKPTIATVEGGGSVRLILKKHWLRNDARGLISLPVNSFTEDWTAFAIRGRTRGWLVKTDMFHKFLLRYPTQVKDGRPVWTVFFGARDGRDMIWLGSEYERGGFMVLNEYAFDIPISQ